MADTNFLQFDSNGTNMLNDTDYNSDTQRLSGVSSGVARSTLYNKQAFQASTMVKALADALVDNDQNAMDNNLTALKQAILNTFVNYAYLNTLKFSLMTPPDYNNASSLNITTNQTYTAPSNGYILIECHSGDNYFNGSIGNISFGIGAGFSNYFDGDHLMLPIASGDILSCSSRKYSSVYFIPCKEV